jgi:lysophospholipase L1-like esterase
MRAALLALALLAPPLLAPAPSRAQAPAQAPAAPTSAAPPPPVTTDNVPAACTVPDELRALQFALPRMATLVREKQPVRILAIGSSSTAGIGATVPAHAYPPRLAAALKRLLPGAEVTVRNDGIGGEVASTTLARMKRAVADWAPDVVLWQIGTNDALQGITAQAFSGILREGIDFVVEQGRDLLLINPQYFPNTPKEELYMTFVQSIERVAVEKRVPMMRRYAIMRYWQSLPAPVLMLSEDGFHMNDLGYQCMAEVLAGGIARRVTQESR